MKCMYFIAIVLPEPLLSEAKSVKHAISKKYKTYAALKSPAHITLVPPFYYEEREEYILVKYLQNYQPEQTPFDIHLNGYDCFPPRVIFINPKPSEELEGLYHDIQNRLVPQLPERKKTSPDFHPHVTVANRDWSPYDFEKAWEEYKDKDFSGTFLTDRFALLKLRQKKWEVLYERHLKE